MERDKDFFDKFLYDLEESEVVDIVEFDMGYVPFTIERISDGSILQLNEDNKTYSYKYWHSIGNRYSWSRLFADHRCPGDFRALGWVKIENLESAHKAFEK